MVFGKFNMKISDKEFARQMRLHALRMVHRASASHIGSCLSITDIVAVLYNSVLNVRADEPRWSERDRFILSKGHACAAVYAALAMRGFFPLSDLETYASDGAKLMAHISHQVVGVEFSTGSLGHGLPFGVGKALALKKSSSEGKVFVVVSDGEMDEGSNWEALLFAAHHKLDNLIVIVDYNKLQSLTSIQNTLGLEPLADKFRAFGCAVREIDGHSVDDLQDAFSHIPFVGLKPTMVIAHTIKGKGVSFMEGMVEWHYRSPNSEQLMGAIKELGGCNA
jgi:transketolase